MTDDVLQHSPIVGNLELRHPTSLTDAESHNSVFGREVSPEANEVLILFPNKSHSWSESGDFRPGGAETLGSLTCWSSASILASIPKIMTLP